MAAGEDQTEAIIFDFLVVHLLDTEGSFVDARFVDVRFSVERKISLCSVGARAPAHPIYGLEACR